MSSALFVGTGPDVGGRFSEHWSDISLFNPKVTKLIGLCLNRLCQLDFLLFLVNSFHRFSGYAINAFEDLLSMFVLRRI
jgi:hypothetical protein